MNDLLFWTAQAVEDRIVEAFRIDALLPRVPRPSAPGFHPTIEYSAAERAERVIWEKEIRAIEGRSNDPRESPTRDQIAAADEAFDWLRWLVTDVGETHRLRFIEWAKGKARGYGHMKPSAALGSMKFSRDKAARAIADRLNKSTMRALAA